MAKGGCIIQAKKSWQERLSSTTGMEMCWRWVLLQLRVRASGMEPKGSPLWGRRVMMGNLLLPAPHLFIFLLESYRKAVDCLVCLP